MAAFLDDVPVEDTEIVQQAIEDDNDDHEGRGTQGGGYGMARLSQQLQQDYYHYHQGGASGAGEDGVVSKDSFAEDVMSHIATSDHVLYNNNNTNTNNNATNIPSDVDASTSGSDPNLHTSGGRSRAESYNPLNPLHDQASRYDP